MDGGWRAKRLKLRKVFPTESEKSSWTGRSAFYFLDYRVMLRKSMATYRQPQHRKKEKSERLRGERDQIKLIDLRFERWQVLGFRRGRRRQDVL